MQTDKEKKGVGPNNFQLAQDSGKGPNSSRIRNEVGGRNPQLGPRIRDAKKAARNIGPQKRNQTIPKGPKASLLEESIIRNSHVLGPDNSGKEANPLFQVAHRES